MRVKTIFLLGLSILLVASLVWAQDKAPGSVRPATITSEVAPNASRVGPVAPNPGIDAQWDLVFWFDSETPVADAYQLGVEYANGHFYVTAASNYPSTPLWPSHRVFVFDATGAIADTFDQWSTPGYLTWGWRDIAYDGTYLYASDDNVVDCFDLAGNSVPANNITIPAYPTGGSFPRALAYDPVSDHFWTGNFGSSMYEFDRSGNIVFDTAATVATAIYGMAWDDGDPSGGPWLWIHDQSPTSINGCTIFQYDPINHNFTGVSYNVPPIGIDTTQIAGGLAFTDEHTSGFYTLVALAQGSPYDAVFELEMYPATNPYAPAAPSPFTVSNNGAALQATLNWTNPSTTYNGNPLTSIDSAVVEREGSYITTISPTTPGVPVVYNDMTVPDTGYFSYTVRCYNDSGAGHPASAGAWIGLDAPDEVTNLTATAGVGQANLSWTNPTTGLHGGYFPAGSIDGYTINRYGPAPTTINVTGLQTGYTDNTISTEGVYYYGVIPYNASGSGPEAFSDPFYYGTIATIPYLEDFDTNDGGYYATGTGLWEWGTPNPSYAAGPDSSCSVPYCWGTDIDTAYAIDLCYQLISPAIALDDYPTLSFCHWFDTEASYDGGNVKISNDLGLNWYILTPDVAYPGNTNTSPVCMTSEPAYTGHIQGFWETVTFDLSAFDGDTVLIKWEFGTDYSVIYPGWYIDNVEVYPADDYCVDLTPDVLTGAGGPNTSVDYVIGAANCGLDNDVYSLSTTSARTAWDVELWDLGLTQIIDSIVVVAQTEEQFVLRVLIPDTADPGESCVAEVIADSRYGSARNVLTDTTEVTTTARFAGTYDIGGGNNDFPNVVAAATALQNFGIAGPVTFDIYTGEYNGQANLPTIEGNSATNTITFQPAMGESPVLKNTVGTSYSTGNCFYLTGADYVTIKDLEFDSTYGYAAINVYYASGDTSTNIRIFRNYFHNQGYSQNYYALRMYQTRDCEVIGNEIECDYYGVYHAYGIRNLFANNMWYNAGYRVFYNYYGSDCEYYYNSMYANCDRMFYMTSHSNATVMNNIIYNYDDTGTEYAYYIATYLPTVSDYNDIYAPNCYVGYYSASLLTLADFQTATGTDANSISEDPYFLSATNLHIDNTLPSPVNAAGTPVTAIDFDFDGDTRDPTTPDIGADEFALNLMDYRVAINPPDQLMEVEVGDSVDFQFIVWNQGSQNDVYDLTATVTGMAWSHVIMDETGSTVIDSLQLAALTADTILLRATVPPTAFGFDTSYCALIAESRYGTTDNILSDTSYTTTVSLRVLAGDYDVGGGNNDFPDPVNAAQALTAGGQSAAVTFYLYTGTYNGQIDLPVVPGNSATNTITFQAAGGESPVIKNTVGTSSTTGNGFYLYGADYVTIKGLEFDSCYYSGIRNYYSPDTSNYNSFTNNYMHNVGYGGSYYGIYLYNSRDCEVTGNEIHDAYYGIYMYYARALLIVGNEIYGAYYGIYNSYPRDRSSYIVNNMVAATNYGIRQYGGYDNPSGNYFNTFYLSGATTSNYGIYLYTGSSYIQGVFMNNIVFNDNTYSTTRGIHISSSSYLPTSDYNDIYVPNGIVGYCGSSYTTLAEWQAGTGLDANSISEDPGLMGATDLHIMYYVPSPVDSAGTPIAGIPEDIDGDLRDALTPDIGADEFDFALLDYCVELNPESYSASGAANFDTDYILYVGNCGSQNDVYDISVVVTGEAWPHTIYDYAGANIIDSIVVNSLTVDSFMVRVSIPGTATYGQTSDGEVTVESRYGSTRNILSDVSNLTTLARMGGTYDIGGGNNDFATVISAANALTSYGVGAACIFEIYTGTYNGQANLPAIDGTDATNTITFRPAFGQSPRLINTVGTSTTTGNCFYFTGADYVTIQGLEFDSTYGYAAINFYYSGSDYSTFNRVIDNYFHNQGTGGSYYALRVYYAEDCQIIGNEIEGDYYGIYHYYGDRNYFANNMMYNATYRSIYNSSGTDLEFYYNSMYDTSSSATFYHYSMTNSRVMNNIMYNRSAYSSSYGAIYISGSVPTVSNYNDLYAPNATRLGYYGGNCVTLADFQTATGTDANSLSEDPQFTSTTDLHILTTVISPVNNMGTPIAGITTDFDGDLRDATTPDIGGDEFVGYVYPYHVVMNPSNTGSIAEPGDIIDYMFYVLNLGSMNDTYDLSVTVTGEAWSHEIRDATGASIISSIAVNAGNVDSFMVRVSVDAGADRETSSNGELLAVSQNMPVDDIYSDTSWIDTAIPPYELITFNWVEINPNRPGSLPGTNSGINGDDVNVGPFAMGFDFPFYDCNLYNQIRICSNGWMTLDVTETGTHLTNEPIPDASTPNLTIAPYWDDMRPAAFGTSTYHGEIYYYYDAANGRFIVEYDSVSHYGSSYLPNEFTFEAIFYTSGEIEYMYKVIDPGTLTPFPSASVGYENETGTEGIQITYNGSGPIEPVSNMGIRILTRCDLPPPPVEVVIFLVPTDPEMVSAVLDWDPVPDAAQYKIYKSYTSPSTGFTLVDSTTLTQWTDASVVAGAPKCFYYVTADDVARDHVGASAGGTFPPASMRYLFTPTHVEDPNFRKR